jgi:spermidine synthase
MSAPLRALIYGLFVLSGATALIYQVTWLRNLSLVFGASFEATSIVLAAFMAGLSAGGYALARRAEQAARPLLLYGLLELGIATFALAVPALLRALDAAYVRAALASDGVTPGLNALRVVMALAILFVPTFLMGGTLPVLTRGFVERLGDFGPRLAWLYGLNTLGAVIGAVAAGFFLIARFGVWHTQLLAVSLNVAVALAAIGAGRFLAPALGPADAGTSDEPGAAPAPPDEVRALRLAFAGTALCGFCALALEVMWTRAISMAVGATTYSFTVMLAAFLTGIWLGSWLHAAFPLRRLGPAVQQAAVLCALGAAAALASFWIPRLPQLAVDLNVELYGVAPRIRSGTALLLGFAVMLPPCVLMGIAFPLAGEARARLASGFGRSAGDALALNTLGSIAGSLCAGFVLIPRLGLQRGMLLAAALYFAWGCLLLGALARDTGPRRMASRALAAVGIAAALLLPWWMPPWDRSLMGAFQNDQLQFWLDGESAASLRERMAGWSVLYYREGRGSTVSVVDQGWNRTVIVNGKAEASDDPVDGHIQLMLGHVPVLAHPNPKKAFVLGMGTGITLGAVTAHPGLEEIVLAEIEPAVLGARPFLAASNGDPLGDPRVRVAIQDGRNYLKTTPERFDVITADPIHPWTSGSVYLYTREYYEIAAAHLAPGGIMCQWLPITGISGENVRSVVASFADVFPHTSLWQTSHDVLVIGSFEPVAIEWQSLVERLKAPRVAAQLGALGLDDAVAFLAEMGMDDAGVRAYAESAPRNTDDNVYLEFSSPLSIGDPDVEQVTLRVNRARSALAASGSTLAVGMPDAEHARLALARRAKNRLLYSQIQSRRTLERLKEVVAEAPDYRPARIELARQLARQGARDLDAGRVPLALARAREAVAAAEEPSAYLLEGSALSRQGRYAEALAPIERAVALAPHRWMAHYQLALALLGAGRNAEASAALERAVALNPAHAELGARLAEVRAEAARS